MSFVMTLNKETDDVLRMRAVSMGVGKAELAASLVEASLREHPVPAAAAEATLAAIGYGVLDALNDA